MKSAPSILGRLSINVIIIAMAWSLAVTAAVWTVVRHEIDELLDNTLEESAQIIHALLAYRLALLPVDGPEQVTMPAPAHIERLIWQVVDDSNKTVMRSHDAPDAPLLANRTSGFSDASDQWRVLTMPMSERHGWTLHVAQDAEERREATIEAAEYTAGVALLIGLGCVFWLRYRIRAELQPLDRLSAAVRGFDPLNADAPLAPVTRAELEPMQQAISALSGRLIQRIANERAFSAHAAHALRTPLAGLDAQLAVALRESPAELRPRLLRTRSAAHRLQRVVTALLALFRSGSEPNVKRVSLSELLTHLSFEHLAIHAEGENLIHADPDLIAAALLNLLDNASRHGASCVIISARKEHGMVLSIRDNGSGIAPDKRTAMQQAISAQTYDGQTGLGLMLADMVARAHGGSLKLCEVESGSLIELHLRDENLTSATT